MDWSYYYDILRSEIDSAFCYYMRNRAFKHPTPGIFSCHGQQQRRGSELVLRGWFMNNWKIDMAVTAWIMSEQSSQWFCDHDSEPGKTSDAGNGRSKRSRRQNRSREAARRNLAARRRMEILLSLHTETGKRYARSRQDDSG